MLKVHHQIFQILDKLYLAGAMPPHNKDHVLKLCLGLQLQHDPYLIYHNNIEDCKVKDSLRGYHLNIF